MFLKIYIDSGRNVQYLLLKYFWGGVKAKGNVQIPSEIAQKALTNLIKISISYLWIFVFSWVGTYTKKTIFSKISEFPYLFPFSC